MTAPLRATCGLAALLACSARGGETTPAGSVSPAPDEHPVAADNAADAAPAAVLVIDAAPAAAVALPSGPPLCTRDECGPAPGYPSWDCPDGVHRGGRGDCVRRSDGTCRWIHHACPGGGGPACAETDCGVPPAYSTWSCPDGTSTGAFEGCARDQGRCGRVHRPCPFAPRRATPPPPQPPPPPPRVARCEPLPPRKELLTWEVRSICAPGGGPAPPPFEKVASLGDGTHIFQSPRECFRARYRKCYSK